FETFRQSLAAVAHYRGQGGRANLVVSEDGLAKLIPDLADGGLERVLSAPANDGERQAAERIRFYRTFGVGFVARPADGRPGLFKKAGNLNYTLRLSEALDAGEPLPRLLHGQFAGGHAEGDVRVGELILLLDKDSLLRPEVIWATVPEFVADPKLVYTQHQTKPANPEENYFTRIMAAFTTNLFANGLPAKSVQGFTVPLVGHNAFLRKEFLKQTDWWPENRVSEDYAKSMDAYRLGYHGKYIAYEGLDFGEYVSETFTVETLKQYRYAFGLLEILFNPPRQWLRSGLLTPEMRLLVKTYPRARILDLYDMFVYLFSFVNSAVALPFTVVTLAFGDYRMYWGGFLANFIIFAVVPSLNIMRARPASKRLDFWTGVSFVAVGPVFLGHTYSIARGFVKFFADGLTGRSRGFGATSVASHRYFGDGVRLLAGYYAENKALLAISVLLLAEGAFFFPAHQELSLATASVAFMMLVPLTPIIFTPAFFRPPRWAARLGRPRMARLASG
ncbi:MAG: glycosyltransferase family 2 protein, partial [Propionibacteriaceae bacterium]|nr:glycosyltransferase family 2 protein [Propionibacteriaceae bacterium]